MQLVRLREKEAGGFGENKDFVATTNDYNSSAMMPYRIPGGWFPDTYIRYDTIFRVQNATYLQPGGPHGTSIEYYWPDNPKPTGEYTKWQSTMLPRSSILKWSQRSSVISRVATRAA